MNTTQSFPRCVRLTEGRDYRQVYAGAKRSSDQIFAVAWVPGKVEYGARLGLAVSRKCARRAVDRQRIKRIVRESFRQARIRLPAVDIVVSCRVGTARRGNRELRRSLESHWSRLNR
ncbi:ribonuclease P protein component [Acidihalobacter ferrooxydans]|uniref:Ribonuclease P protein component n=1 Tax=Acidihalobacter ferrooxydans TaxID=1765967 RepID=A0A1P8UL05_9GAMM|nr:ribonuclease P protein component [Acidihalobacter ferrooxydans]APZ44434.1 ribonuclease P protein component [Acidihalobacter ferrooxydans]